MQHSIAESNVLMAWVQLRRSGRISSQKPSEIQQSGSLVLYCIDHRVVMHFAPGCFDPEAIASRSVRWRQAITLAGGIPRCGFRRANKQTKYDDCGIWPPHAQWPKNCEISDPVIPAAGRPTAGLVEGYEFGTSLDQSQTQKEKYRECKQPSARRNANSNRSSDDPECVKERQDDHTSTSTYCLRTQL